jgi:ParB family chromosome partitioning protein
MKLPTNNASHIKVPLSCLKITDNVRMNFDEAEIEELANSIRQNGLMNPITVRPPETDADGNKTYEVIAGGRRIRAHQWLCEHGDDFSLIECCIRTGDKWALQMIENIQRTDLTPREKENAVAKALKEGLTQTQIADKLSKPIQWVSDIVAGAKIRKIADAAGLNTEEITTKTLSQLRSIPEEKLESCLTQLIAEGGTYRAATRMMQEEKNPATTHVSTPDEDFISDDESMISPTEMSEKDFHDDVDFEKDRKESDHGRGLHIPVPHRRVMQEPATGNGHLLRICDPGQAVCVRNDIRKRKEMRDISGRQAAKESCPYTGRDIP